MRGTIENFSNTLIDYKGIHIVEKRNNQIVDVITVNSEDYDVEELAIEMIEDLTHNLYQYLKESKTEAKAKEVIKYVLEQMAEETLNDEIKEWGKE